MIDSEAILQEIMPNMVDVGTVWVAFSGGLDSSVLLHLASRWQQSSEFADKTLAALHVNHQLSSQATRWREHCHTIAANYKIPFVCETVTVAKSQRGVEHEAREQRYRAFAKHMGDRDVMLFAHHAEDQAETMLFRLLRGSGLTGLCGMAASRPLARGKLLRPLLHHSKQQLCAYAAQYGLEWVEDESNFNTDFDRNFLRQQIFPLLRDRWASAVQKMTQSAQWLSEAEHLLMEHAEQDLCRCQHRKERLGESIALETFFDFSVARQKNIIRFWVKRHNYTLPSADQLAQLSSLLSAKIDGLPTLAWGQCELRRYANRVYLIPRLGPVNSGEEVEWSGATVAALADGSRLECLSAGTGPFQISFRCGGERCKPLTRGHSQRLKKLLQEYAVEPWLRDRAPLIRVAGAIVAVADIFACDARFAGGGVSDGNGQCAQSKPNFRWYYPS
ncbi:MAG: tRNA(Ile)-lysidine synthase [Lentisphaeria bacterium]|jgi:tRNA(Ile)-lysidine synthase